MAKDARIRIRIDASQGKREVDDINRKLDKTEKKAEAFAVRARRVLGVATAGAAIGAAAIEKAVGGGFISAATGTFGALLGKATRALAGGPLEGLELGISRNNALDQAISQVSELVGRGGSITDAEIKSLIVESQNLFAPGQQNIQRVQRIGGDIRGSQAIGNAADVLQDILNEIRTTRLALSRGGNLAR